MADGGAHFSLIHAEPVTGQFGAEISGVDLSQDLSPELFREINQALLDYGVIFFRDQDITPAQHIAFGRHWGELHIHPFIPALEGYPEIIRLGGKTPGPGRQSRNANAWHTDLTYTTEPPMGSILHGVEIPSSGGDTMFVDLCAAYDGLSERMQQFLTGLKAVHSITQTKNVYELSSNQEVGFLAQALERVPPGEHPVICTHPENGRKILYVNSHFTAYIKDVTELESQWLLNMLHAHINKPEYQCRFRWRRYSLAFWDNRRTQHYAVSDYTEMRNMHRVTVKGALPRA